MNQKPKTDDVQQRVEKILHGAFAGPPTPLKDIPKRNGESRGSAKPQRRKRRQPQQVSKKPGR